MANWWIRTHGTWTIPLTDGSGAPIDATGAVNVTVVDANGTAIADGTTWPVDVSGSRFAQGNYKFSYKPVAAGVIQLQVKATAGGVPVVGLFKATIRDIWDAVASHPPEYAGNTIRLVFTFTADADGATAIPLTIYSRDTRQSVLTVPDISGFRQSAAVYFYDWQAPPQGQYAAQALGTVGGLVQGVPLGINVRDPLTASNSNP